MENRSSRKAKQTFRLTSPTAQNVLLVGDFTQWQQHPIPLRRGDNGVWQTTVSLEPGEHHYRFVVDGEWRDDPDCAMRVPNPFGSQDMVSFVN